MREVTHGQGDWVGEGDGGGDVQAGVEACLPPGLMHGTLAAWGQPRPSLGRPGAEEQ